VLWINPYPTRLPHIRDLARSADLHRQGTSLPERLSVLNPHGLPIEPLPGGAWINRQLKWRPVLRQLAEFSETERPIICVGRPSALALDTVQKLAPSWSFYDAMDDFPQFYRGLSKLSMKNRERQISKSVNTIYVSSLRLKNKFIRWGLDVRELPNGYDMKSLPAYSETRKEAVTIGYVGTIGSWFDWDVVFDLARSCPVSEIRLVGPCFSPPARQLPGNVKLLPPCSQREVVDHLQSFTIGLIPFKKTSLTGSVDPIKYYEYKAMGLPIISTMFGEMSHRRGVDGVFFLERDTNLANTVSMALAWKANPDAVEKFRKENDWKTRFDRVGLFQGQKSEGE